MKEKEMVWSALVEGRDIERLHPDRHNGRIDLRDLVVSSPKVAARERIGAFDVTRSTGITTVQGQTLAKVDFSGAQLRSVRFDSCTFKDCVFKSADATKMSFWGCTLVATVFEQTVMQECVFGVNGGGKPCVIADVAFDRSDLSGLVCSGAEFERCRWYKGKMHDMSFRGCRLRDCEFVGKMRVVRFIRDRNPDVRCDAKGLTRVAFSGASLHEVDFQGLDLDGVTWPVGPEYLIVDNWRSALTAAIDALQSAPEEWAAEMSVLLRYVMDRSGPSQQRGLLVLTDLSDDPEAVEWLGRNLSRGTTRL